MRRAPAIVSLIVLGACTPPPRARVPLPPVSTGKVRVRVFTEPSPVRLVASAGRYVFVATARDVERWDEGGGVVPLSARDGLRGRQIVALAPDVDQRWVWILTEQGLGRYDITADAFQPVAAPPTSLGVDFAALARDGASVAPAADGGAWVGTAHGLYAVDAAGMWTATALKDPVYTLARDAAGWLWVATRAGLVVRKPTGDLVQIGPLEGFAIVEPRLLVELPDARMMVVGAGAAGRDLIAFGKELQWQTYRALPDARWDAAARRGNGAVLMTEDRLYRISPKDPARVRPLMRDGKRLVSANAGGRPADWVIDPVDLVVPPGAVTLTSVDDALLIGTRELGTARYHDGEPRPRDWLRRRQMFLDASTLSVACAALDDCWIATGTRRAWHWDGEGFEPRGPDERVFAMIRDPAGAIYAIHRADDDRALRVSRIDRASAALDAPWIALPKLALSTPNTAELAFARFTADGALWVGLRDRVDGEPRPYAIAIVEPATGKVTYQANDLAAELPALRDGDVRTDAAWLATGDGVARIAGGTLERWAEPARAVAVAADGSVVIATRAGLGRWDGRQWTYPPVLGFENNDVVTTESGQIWIATPRGIAAWDGRKLRRLDTRRGLAENDILDVAVDRFDRVWARGPGSLMLVSQ